MVSVAWTQPAGGYLANATFPANTLEFAYDGLSRRVQKKTIKNGTAEMEGYVYDGWNVVMISKLDAGNGAHLVRKWSCVWRPDIGSRLYARGSWQAAGGVGGLAWMQTGIAQTVAMYTYQSVSGNAEVHIPMMDHMGNVRHYYQIKSTGPGAAPATVTGQITANLDYDAFGREVRATGPKTPGSGQPPGLAPDDPWVDNLPFHFSTKFTDRETGLNYYGYRFYDPVDGRWLNRDPIGERGGPNLYAMVENSPVLFADTLGLFKVIIHPSGLLEVTVESCEIVLIRGHGLAAAPHKFFYPPAATGESDCRRVGFQGCEAGNIMGPVPEGYYMPGSGRHREGEQPEPDQSATYTGLSTMLDNVRGEAEGMCKDCDPPCKKVRLAVLNYLEPSPFHKGYRKGFGGTWHLYQLNIPCDNVPKSIPKIDKKDGWDSKDTLEVPW